MGLQAADPDTARAAAGGRVVTPSGHGARRLARRSSSAARSPPTIRDDPDGDGVTTRSDLALVDHMEFYLLNYFKPGTYDQTPLTQSAAALMQQFGCTGCHVQNLTIDHDRRVADVETTYDPVAADLQPACSRPRRRSFNEDGRRLRASADQAARCGARFVVRNFFADLKRHDLGPASTSATSTARCRRSS